jgi:hypothetical protein
MAKEVEHPPAARLAFRVGVVGHRPNRLTNADESLLRLRLRDVFERVHEAVRRSRADTAGAYAKDAPSLRVVSALAEGADQLAVQEALALGWELQAPLPFLREEYERDFITGESRDAFRALLESAQTTAVLELDGSREDAPGAYEAVGRMVIRQCDVLVAIWDGEPAAGAGGTTQMIGEALSLGMTVVWIKARVPHEVSLLSLSEEGTRQAQSVELLADHVRQRLAPPAVPKNEIGAEQFLNERRPVWTLGWLFTLFCNIVAFEWRPLVMRLPDFTEATRQEWRGVWPQAPAVPAIETQLDRHFLRHFAWADKLANAYANIYRTSFLSNYLLAAVAVTLALMPYGFHLTARSVPEIALIASEFIVIVFIISMTGLGSYRRLHERWIEYRLLAEQLRDLIFLAPLGRTTPAFRIPAYAVHDDPRNTWVSWHFRSIVRAAGMMSFRMDAAGMNWYREFLANELADQTRYHERTAERSDKIGTRLHYLAAGLFVLTAIIVFVHIFDGRIGNWGTVASAAIPAFGAAIAGILGQAEFHRIRKRSGALEQGLAGLSQILKAEGGKTPRSLVLGQIAESMADVMTADVLDWRTVFRERPLTLPS